MTDENEIKKDTVDYRDPTPFYDTKLNSISEISKGIRHKNYGKDVREALAQQGEALVKLIQDSGGNQAAEVQAARGNFELLGIREDAQDNTISTNQASLSTKADKNYIDNYLSQVSHVPETVASLAALKQKYPHGQAGLLITADTGHKYIWTNKAWHDAGPYQTQGIPNHSLEPSKLAPNAQKATLFSAPLIYDLPQKKLIIPGDSPARIVWDKQSQDDNKTYYSIPKTGIVVANEAPAGATNFKLIFNTANRTFALVGWGQQLAQNDLFVGGLVSLSAHFPQSFNIIGDIKLIIKNKNNLVYSPELTNQLLPVGKIVGVGQQKPYVNSTQKQLVFPPNSFSYGIIVGNKNYDNIIPASGLNVDLSCIDTTTTAWLLLFDIKNRCLLIDKYANAIYHNNDVALLATIRYAATSPRQYHFNAYFPLIEDNYINGIMPLQTSHIKSIAHRGCSKTYPENTLPAYQAALRQGYRYVETDIQWTQDEVPVLLHDETINRTARDVDGSELTQVLKIKNLTLTAAQQYDFGHATSAAFAGTKLMTLADFLSFCQRKGIECYLDKSQTQTHAEKIVQLVKWYNLQDHVTYIAPDITTLTYYRQADPDCRIGLDSATIDQGSLTKLKDLGGSIFANLQCERLIEKPALADLVKKSGIALECWTINQTAQIDALLSLGVSGLTNNEVDVNGYLLAE